MGFVDIVCCNCGNKSKKSTGHYNRAVKLKAKLYCSRECWIKKPKTPKAVMVERKRLYDLKYRAKNLQIIKAKKAEYFKNDYKNNPEKYRLFRKKRQKKHNEYCRRPEYKAWKKEYDQKWRAKRTFGEFWEAQVALLKLDNLIETKMSNYEIRLKNNTLNKALKRSRNGNTKRRYA